MVVLEEMNSSDGSVPVPSLYSESGELPEENGGDEPSPATPRSGSERRRRSKAPIDQKL